MDVDPLEYLQAAGALSDEMIDVAPCAICLAAVGPGQYEGRNLERYFHHLKVLGEEVAQRYAELVQAGGAEDALTRLAALKHILADKYGYSEDQCGERQDMRCADMIAVIDRARGGDMAIAILYLQAARAQGWDVEPLSFPGRCLLRIETDGRRIIFDPAQAAAPMDAPQIRSLLKQELGAQAELSASYFEPISGRDLLVRMLNTIKFRQIEEADYWGALETIESARMIAPAEFRLLLDAGVMYSKTGQPEKAEEVLVRYIDAVQEPRDRRDAELLLAQIRMTTGE